MNFQFLKLKLSVMLKKMVFSVRCLLARLTLSSPGSLKRKITRRRQALLASPLWQNRGANELTTRIEPFCGLNVPSVGALV